MTSKIAVIGTGYVGLTTGACFAHLGHDVICADIVPEKVERAAQGRRARSSKPGLDRARPARASTPVGCRFVLGRRERRGRRRVRLPVRADAAGRRRLGRPQLHPGGGRARSARICQPGAIVVNKSTVPVGSTRVVEQALGRTDVPVVSNPEFLREGSAVDDFLNPDRVVIGADDQAAAVRVAALYLGVRAPIMVTDPASAETIKYAANAFLATKLVVHQRHRRGLRGRRCRRQRRRARHGLRQAHRPRVPAARSRAGAARASRRTRRAIISIAEDAGYDFALLRGVVAVNDEQFDRIVRKVGSVAADSTARRSRLLGPDLQGRHRRPPRVAGARGRSAG